MTSDNIAPLTPQQDQEAIAIALDEAYKSGYHEATGGRKVSNNFDLRMMDTLFACKLPSDDDDFDNYLAMIRVVIDILPKIPNYDMAFHRELMRDFEDIVDQAHSEGNVPGDGIGYV